MCVAWSSYIWSRGPRFPNSGEEHFPATEEATLDRWDGASQAVGNFVKAQFVEFTEHHNLAVLDRK